MFFLKSSICVPKLIPNQVIQTAKKKKTKKKTRTKQQQQQQLKKGNMELVVPTASDEKT